MVSIETIEEGAFLSQSPRNMLFDNNPIPLVWDICNGEGIHALAGIYSFFNYRTYKILLEESCVLPASDPDQKSISPNRRSLI